MAWALVALDALKAAAVVQPGEESVHTELALDRFNVTNLVTFGSPVDSAPIPPSINVLALQHAGDPVPKADLADATVWPGGIVSSSRDNGAVVVELLTDRSPSTVNSSQPNDS